MKSSYLSAGVVLTSIFVVMVFTSCQKKIKVDPEHAKIIKNWNLKTIILPWDYIYKNGVGKQNEFESISQKELKILTLIDTSCPECVKELEKWQTFKSSVDTTIVGFIFMLYSSDQFLSLDEKLIQNTLMSPYLKDIGGIIFKRNKFPLDKRYQSFLLNSEDQVILLGNPTRNLEIYNLYLECIDNYYNKDHNMN